MKKFEAKWKEKKDEIGGQESYTFKKHADWYDKRNKGATYFGVHQDLLSRNEIRFDTLHLKCFITRRMIESVRYLLLNQLDELKDKFLREVQSKFWNEFYLFI